MARSPAASTVTEASMATRATAVTALVHPAITETAAMNRGMTAMRAETPAAEARTAMTGEVMSASAVCEPVLLMASTMMTAAHAETMTVPAIMPTVAERHLASMSVTTAAELKPAMAAETVMRTGSLPAAAAALRRAG